jgi:hypothetical protein
MLNENMEYHGWSYVLPAKLSPVYKSLLFIEFVYMPPSCGIFSKVIEFLIYITETTRAPQFLNILIAHSE